MEAAKSEELEAGEPPHPQPRADLDVVGIGASAGGLEALERLFKAMPDETGLAFVVVQHLSPDFRSLMDELLARHTGMHIHRVTDGMAIEKNSIYLLPPKKEMIVSGGRLLLTDKDPAQDPSLPIDHFFRSLARDAGERGVAIVLSGTGSDGSRGVRDVHEAGGLVIAQSPETARFDGMPKSAVDTGVVAQVLAPEDIPGALLDYTSRATPPPPSTPFDTGLTAAYDRLLDRYMPPGVLLTERRVLVHAFGDVGRYLGIPKGRTTMDVLDLVKEELRLPLAGALQRAVKDRAPVVHPAVLAQGAEGPARIEIEVEPIFGAHSSLTHLFVAFAAPSVAAPGVRPTEIDPTRASHELVDSLEAELHNRAYALELERANLELRESIARREEAEQEAREGVDRRDRFLAILSHELRNPIAAISNASRLLDREDTSETSRRQAQSAIARQSRLMARLLDDLLDVSRITRNKIEIHAQRIDVCQASREAIELVAPLVEARRQRLQASLPEEPLYIDGDPARLQQIQVNLLTNAIKYAPPASDIELSVYREGDEAVICVRDHGSGIPDRMRDRIFDLFVQLDGAVGNSDGGMGVGLTLVRSLVKLHGGRVAVRDPATGTGSEFVVHLPITSAADDAVRPAVQRPGLAGIRIVVIEDNADIRETTTILLRTLGCDAVAAEDGQQGLAAVERHRAEVALVDIGMPGMDGYEVARRIRARGDGARIALIALTGFGQAQHRARAHEAGFDAHLVKPIDLDELTAAILRISKTRSGAGRA